MIRDQSCLNLIAIEPRTQGDHKELTNLLQNCLISSRFNQKLCLQGEEHCFIGNFLRKIRAVRFADEDWMAMIVRFSGSRSHVFVILARAILIDAS